MTEGLSTYRCRHLFKGKVKYGCTVTSVHMKQSHKTELVELFSKIDDPKIMDSFLENILTPAELEDVVLRLQLVKLLESGMPQREIAEKLGISISKVTRGSRALQEKNSGFKHVFDRYYKNGF